MREWVEFRIENCDNFRNQLLKWGSGFEYFVFLNSNRNKTHENLYPLYDSIAACRPEYVLNYKEGKGFETFKDFNQQQKDWIFGYLSYDLKNETEHLSSENYDGIEFPNLHFVVPGMVFVIKGNRLKIGYLPETLNPSEIKPIFQQISSIIIEKEETASNLENIKQRFSKEEYIKTIEAIKTEILHGNIYELNLCQEFYAENIKIDPTELYKKLNLISPAPFSAFYKLNEKFLLSSSPERFLAKRGSKIISQPIKGTIKRGKDVVEDMELKNSLSENEKERAENIMIVDLVRNDLSKTSKKGSVRVEELCKIYSFEQVHQMISTISSEINLEKYDLTDVIKNAFPMGSMTGAPKIKAMELIEKFEKTKRGLYSGAVGYIDPDKNFDFNVVIRSILYHSEKKYLSFIVGGAITHQSDAEKEYEECLLKAQGLKLALGISD